MKTKFFKSAKIFLSALPHFILFEVIFKLIITSSAVPVLMMLLKVPMKLSGVKYISDEKAWIYLKNPATLIVLALILFFTAVFTFIEFSALTMCFSCREKGEKVTTGRMFHAGLYALRKSLRKDGFFSFFKFMLFMPLVQFTLSSGVFMIPLFPVLKKAFAGTIPATVVYILLQLILIFQIISYSYSLHYLLLTDKSFKECTEQSHRLIDSRKKRIKQAVSVISWGAFMIVLTAVVTFAVSFLILLCIKGLSNPDKAFLSAVKVLRYARQVFSAISSFLVAPSIICRLTGKFFSDIPQDEHTELPDIRYRKIGRRSKGIIITVILSVTFLLNYNYIKAVYKGNISLVAGITTRTQVTAHRGFSYKAPENTIYAFEYAIESGADYIELDVQLTADEQVVVFHDERTDRTTGIAGRISDCTYEELQKFPADYRFRKSGKFRDAGIPLLSEVFDTVKNQVLYNIEIKDKGNPLLTVQKTVELIEEYGLESSCYVTSFSYNVLKEVKKTNPEIKTGLIANSTAMAFSHLKNIDALSLNYIFVNSAVVQEAHRNGKRVFVWTVDSTNDIQNMISIGVDNIITNRPDKATEIVYSKSISSKVLMILKLIFKA